MKVYLFAIVFCMLIIEDVVSESKLKLLITNILKSKVHSVHTHILKTTFRNMSECNNENSKMVDLLCQSYNIYELNSLRFNYPLTTEIFDNIDDISFYLKCNNSYTKKFESFTRLAKENIQFPTSYQNKPPILFVDHNIDNQLNLIHLLKYLNIKQEVNELLLLSTFENCNKVLSQCKLINSQNTKSFIDLSNIEEVNLIRNIEIIIQSEDKNIISSSLLNNKLCNHSYPYFLDIPNVIAFLEESETSKVGMMSPFLDLFAQPGTDQINSIVTAATVDDVSRNVGRTVQSNTPEVVTEHVAKALQDNITELATDAVTYKISKDITMLLTENIHPYLHTHIMEEVEPDVSLVLTEKLRQYVPHWLNTWIPMLLERSLAPALTGYVTRAVSNALTPAVILAVKQTYPQLFEFPQCHDTVCRYDNQVISKYYASMFSAYFTNYYQEYYIPYYQKAIVNVDDWVYTDKMKTSYPDGQM